MNDKEIFELVEAAKVFEKHKLNYGGFGLNFSSVDDFREWLIDPDLVEANYYGVKKESYVAWRNGQKLKCSYFLKSGRQCRNDVLGSYAGIGVNEYEKLIGGYCHKHGG